MGKRYHVGASFGSFRSDLSFIGKDGPDASIRRQAFSVSFDYRLSATTTFSAGLGAGTGGLLIASGVPYDILPGWLVSASFSRRLVEGRGPAPFVILGLTLGVSGANVRAAATDGDPLPAAHLFYAVDFRAGLTVGKTFEGVLSPYAAVRLFGGPVIWERDETVITGGDNYHYQLAGGLVASLPRGFDLFAEAAPLGERAVNVGGGVTF